MLGSSHPSVIPTPGNHMTSSVLWGSPSHAYICIDIDVHTHKQNKHEKYFKWLLVHIYDNCVNNLMYH